jgi:hypothetical protein
MEALKNNQVLRRTKHACLEDCFKTSSKASVQNFKPMRFDQAAQNEEKFPSFCFKEVNCKLQKANHYFLSCLACLEVD